MMFSIVFLLTFAFAALSVIAANRVLERSRPVSSGTFDGDAPIAGLFKEEQLSSISLWHALLARFNFVQILSTHIEQSAVRWSVGRLTLSMLLAGTVVFTALARTEWMPLWASMGAGWLAALAPYAYVLRARTRRFRAFQAEFPDTLDSISRALRAGYAFPAALDSVSRDTSPPISTELRKASAELNLGVPMIRVLDGLSNRMPLVEVEMFAAAVQLHSRTGGRLTDVLTVLAENIREQSSLQGEVRAMAAQGRAAGLVLTIMPIVIAGVMAIVSPVYIAVLLAHPYGKHLIGAAIVCLILAHIVIRKIVDIRI
jgi:tight adherence protein B